MHTCTYIHVCDGNVETRVVYGGLAVCHRRERGDSLSGCYNAEGTTRGVFTYDSERAVPEEKIPASAPGLPPGSCLLVPRLTASYCSAPHLFPLWAPVAVLVAV